VSLYPLAPEHGLVDPVLGRVEHDAQMFDAALRGRPAGRLFRDDEFVSYAFVWQRWAAARFALEAMERERTDLGDAFDLDELRGRGNAYVVVSEAAGVLSGWLDADAAAAATAVASSLRSAFWLWLEDDDRAMGVLRSTLEQLARMRTWRRNPGKALKLEARESTTPRDWLDAAGWRRLEALNRALGEMAHTRGNSRWSGARKLLAKLQPEAEHSSLQTARGFALTTVAMLAAAEVVASAMTVSPAIGACLDEVLAWRNDEGVDDEQSLERLLARAWGHRSTSLGEPEFEGPAQAWEAAARAGDTSLAPE
jgi:hypothetical protein